MSPLELDPELERHLLAGGSAQRMDLTRLETLSPVSQELLARDRDPFVREWLAAHRALHGAARPWLLHDDSYQVRSALALNPSLTPLELEHLLCTPDLWPHLAKNPALNAAQMLQLTSHDSPPLLEHLACNPALTPELFEQLAPLPAPAFHLASNPALTASAAVQLSQHEDLGTLGELARNPALPLELLESVLDEALNVLMASPEPMAPLLSQQTRPRALLAGLATNPARQLELLEIPWLGRHLASNPSLVPRVQRALLHPPRTHAISPLRELLMNPALDLGLLGGLEALELDQLAHLALNPGLTREQLDAIAARADWWTLGKLARNPSLEPHACLPYELLRQLPLGRLLVHQRLWRLEPVTRAALEPSWAGTLDSLATAIEQFSDDSS